MAAVGLCIRNIVNRFNAVLLEDGEVEREDLIFMITVDDEVSDKYKTGDYLNTIVNKIISPTEYNINSSRSKEERNKERFKMWEQGFTDSEIAEKENVNASTILQWRSRNKLKCNFKEQYEQINKRRFVLYKKGLSDLEIAEKEGSETKTIGSWRQRNKLPINKK